SVSVAAWRPGESQGRMVTALRGKGGKLCVRCETEVSGTERRLAMRKVRGKRQAVGGAGAGGLVTASLNYHCHVAEVVVRARAVPADDGERAWMEALLLNGCPARGRRPSSRGTPASTASAPHGAAGAGRGRRRQPCASLRRASSERTTLR